MHPEPNTQFDMDLFFKCREYYSGHEEHVGYANTVHVSSHPAFQNIVSENKKSEEANLDTVGPIN